MESVRRCTRDRDFLVRNRGAIGDHNQPFSRASRAASTRFLAPSFAIAVDR